MGLYGVLLYQQKITSCAQEKFSGLLALVELLDFETKFLSER